MAFALTVDVVPPGGGKVTVQHVFWGDTEAQARAAFAAHADGCEFLTPAIAEDRIEEDLEEISDDERPEYEFEEEEGGGDGEEEGED